MTRVKKAKHAHKRRRKMLKRAKGYRFGRSKKERQAKEAVIHAGAHAFRHRKKKKRDFRQLWQTKINAAARKHDMSYSTFVHALKEKGVGLNRKMLAHVAEHNPKVFDRIIKHIS